MTSGALRCLYPSNVMEKHNTSDICWTNKLNKDNFLVFQYSDWCSLLSPQAFLIQKDRNHNFPADDTLKNLF
jgi:hypothetical protein